VKSAPLIVTNTLLEDREACEHVCEIEPDGRDSLLGAQTGERDSSDEKKSKVTELGHGCLHSQIYYNNASVFMCVCRQRQTQCSFLQRGLLMEKRNQTIRPIFSNTARQSPQQHPCWCIQEFKGALFASLPATQTVETRSFSNVDPR